jgi:hypothetical protein
MDSMGNFSRQRSNGGGEHPQTRIATFFDADGNNQSGQYSVTYHTINDYRYIADCPHRLAHGAFGWKYPPGKVFHVVTDTTRLLPMAGIWPTSVAGSYWQYDSTTFPPITSDLIDSIIPSVSDVDFFSLNREAFNYFSDAFPQKMNFSEFVEGLFELKELLPSIQESISKSFSGGYLNKEFGWDNLFSDLNTLGGIVQTARDRLDFLLRVYGIPTRLGFSRPNLAVLSHSVGNYAEANVYGPYTTRLTLSSCRVDMRASCTLLETLDYLTGTMGLIRSLVGAFGLNNPLKAFWQVLPFSFVADWFFRIGDHLDTVTRAEPATGWNVSNVTCSYKTHAVYDVSVTHLGGGVDYTRPKGKIIRDEYRRFVGLPLSLVDLLPTSELSPTQLTLLLALLHQQG